MSNFQAREREVAPDAAAAALKPYRVPSEAVEYGGRAHLYRCVLKGKHAPKTAVELTAPGAWDNCTLEPWDEIDVTYGRSPMDAHHGRVRVLAIPKQGLRRWEDLHIFPPPAGKDGFLATNSLFGFTGLIERAYASVFDQMECWRQTAAVLGEMIELPR